MSFAAGYQYMGKRSAVDYYNPDPATRFLPDHNLLDASVSYSNEKFNISLNVYNITNTEYAALGYFNADINEWRYTPGEPINFRLSIGVNLLRNKKNK
jgi:outer membrane receptor protein involved in Fe transport